MRIRYRASQFFNALFASPNAEQLAQAQDLLTPDQYLLFLQMQPGEQAHSLGILRELLAQGESDPDLLTAALLHDVGKTRCPLQLWERVFIVIGKAIFPDQAQRWGAGEPVGWKRAFVVAEQHAVWSAELAARAGASPMAVEIIRRHQSRLDFNPLLEKNAPPTERLLHRLQLVDDES